MRIRPRDVCVNQRGAKALAAVLGGALASRITLERLRAVALLNMQPGKASDQSRDASARSLDFHGNGNRKPLSSIRYSSGSFLLQAVFRDSQNSPSLVEPSPPETYTISS